MRRIVLFIIRATVSGAALATAGHAAGAQAPSPLKQNDVYVIERILIGDSVVAAVSESVHHLSTQPNVRNVSEMLATDHALLLKRMLVVIRTVGVTRNPDQAESARLDLSGAFNRVMATTAAEARDVAYLDFVMRELEFMLALARVQQGSVNSAELATDLRARVPVLEQHLNRARKVREKLGGEQGKFPTPIGA